MPVSRGAAEDAPHDDEASRHPEPHEDDGATGVLGSGCAGRKLGAGILCGSSTAGRFRRLPCPVGGLGGAGGGRYAPPFAALVHVLVGGGGGLTVEAARGCNGCAAHGIGRSAREEEPAAAGAGAGAGASLGE